MKRLALALLLLAPVAQARTAIIIDRDATQFGASTIMRADYASALQIGTSTVASFINRYNPGSVDTYTADKVWTQLIKDGKVSLSDRGSTTGPYKTYSAVIWIGNMALSNNSYHVGCASCSLTFISNAATAAVPTVPQLFLSCGLGGESGFNNASTCSTGTASGGMDPSSDGPSCFSSRLHLVGSKKGWPENVGSRPGIYQPDANPAGVLGSGTYRVVLGNDDCNTSSNLDNSGSVRYPYPSWRDSMVDNPGNTHWLTGIYLQHTGPAYGDYITMRYNDNFSGAKPNIFCIWQNHHSPPTGGGDTDPPDTRIQPDPTNLYIALALLDSCADNAVLGTTVEPAKLAVQISGGFRRGLKTSAGGFAPFDSTQVGLSCDSLRALGIPIAVGADPESIGTYASDKAMWARAGGVRFALESSRGSTADTALVALGNVLTGTYNPSIIDPFGRYRSRAFVGATSDTTDTSMASILKRARYLLAARLGVNVGSLDRVAMASGDDYSPRNWNSGGIDSVALALAAAGFSGVSQTADDSAAATTSNRVGYGSNQRYIRGTMFVTTPGFNPRGATYGNGTLALGDGSLSDSSWCISYTKRSLWGLFNGFWENPQKYPWLKNASPAAMSLLWLTEPGIHAEISPASNTRTGVNLVRITASSLGSGDLTSTPNRPGFYQLKYLKYQVDAINSFGRNLIVFTYPDGLGPQDIKR